MTSNNDVIVKVLWKLFLSKHGILYSLKRKSDADQLLTKDVGLKIYGTEGMTSYSDIIVSIFRKLSPLKHQFERKFDYNDFLTKYSE